MSLREGHGLDGFRAPSLVFWTLLSELGKNTAVQSEGCCFYAAEGNEMLSKNLALN